MTVKKTNLLSGRHLAVNVVWNLLGIGAPLLVAIFAIPMLIEGLGTARFGVLTLAWMVVGYFSLFDLGLGRALTKLVAEKLGQGQGDETPLLIWTAMSLMAVLSVLGAIVVAALSPWLVNSVLKIPVELQSETLTVFYLLALSIPIVVSTTGLRGVLEAHQRFGLVNAVRIPLGIFTFLGPVAVLPFSNNLVAVVAALVCVRLVSWVAYGVLCLHIEPALRHSVSFHRETVRPLMHFGGWMTVTNLVSPLMVYMDRFLIGAVVSMSAVAYYATPFEVVNKLLIVPSALMGVLFPVFAAALAQDRSLVSRLFNRAVNYIAILLFPVVLIIVTFAHEALTFWIGSEFANNSSLLLQILTIGVFINSLTYVPFGLIQGAGRPDITAKLHLAELPFYLLILWWSLDVYGVTGAAVAWVLRISVDALLCFIIANKFLSTPLSFTFHSFLVLSTVFFLLALGASITEPLMKGGFLLLAIFIVGGGFWFAIFDTEERDLIRNSIKAMVDSMGQRNTQ